MGLVSYLMVERRLVRRVSPLTFEPPGNHPLVRSRFGTEKAVHDSVPCTHSCTRHDTVFIDSSRWIVACTIKVNVHELKLLGIVKFVA